MTSECHSEQISTKAEHEHIDEPRLRDLQLRLTNLPRFLLLGLIRLYQATFSRTLPQDTCRFYPSCSHYGYQAIYKYGVIKGGLMAIWRVLRCNPFNPGGIDPVP
jgi:putative membrane protein insertion efficiency factor